MLRITVSGAVVAKSQSTCVRSYWNWELMQIGRMKSASKAVLSATRTVSLERSWAPLTDTQVHQQKP